MDKWRASICLFHGNMAKGILVHLFFLSLPILVNCLTNLFRILQPILCSICCTIKDNLDNDHISSIILTLLYLVFDIEQNQGPSSIPADLSILHLNIRSIRNKTDFIKDNCLVFNILCFSETYLNPQISNDNLLLPGAYDEPYRKDSTNHGGGLLFYLNTELVYSRRQNIEIFCEVEIKVTTSIYLLGLFYSPRTADTIVYTYLNLNIEKANDFTKQKM